MIFPFDMGVVNLRECNPVGDVWTCLESVP
jgi:hypothetical protein